MMVWIESMLAGPCQLPLVIIANVHSLYCAPFAIHLSQMLPEHIMCIFRRKKTYINMDFVIIF